MQSSMILALELLLKAMIMGSFDALAMPPRKAPSSHSNDDSCNGQTYTH